MMKLQWPGTKFETVLQLSLSIFQYCLCLFLIAFHLNFLSDFVQNRYERQIILIVDPDCMFVRPIDYIIEAGAPIAQVWTCNIIPIILCPHFDITASTLQQAFFSFREPGVPLDIARYLFLLHN